MHSEIHGFQSTNPTVRSMMSYASLPNFFWGYALETTQYMLNLVNSKAVSTTSKELWTGRKPSLGHVRIWGSSAHVLKRDPIKLEARIDVFLFLGYLKGIKGYLFYDPQEQRVIVSTNICFLEEEYMVDNKPRSKVILDELRVEGVVSIVMGTKFDPPRVASTRASRVSS